jgi:hypothetical protein
VSIRTFSLGALARATVVVGLPAFGLGVPSVALASPLQAVPSVTISGPVAGLGGCQLKPDDNTPLIVGDPSDPNRLFVTYLTGDQLAVVGARSSDGGRTWSRTLLPGMTGCGGGSDGAVVDPGLALTSTGTLLAGEGWIAANPQPGALNHDVVRELVGRSVDGGASWSPPVDVEPAQPDQRSYMATGPHRSVDLETERAPGIGAPAPIGLLYAQGLPNQVVALHSADDGRSWASPATIATAAIGHDLLAGGMLRARDGTLVGLYGDVDVVQAGASEVAGQLALGNGAIPTTLRAVRSTDGGRTFSGDLPIAPQCRSCLLPTGTVGPDGALLVAFGDVQPDNSDNLYLARSTDDGRSWMRHLITHTAPDNADGQRNLGASLLAVATRPGQIGVLSVQPVGGTGEPVDAILWTSEDAGASWESLTLGGPYSRSTITYQHADGPLGRTVGLVALPNGFGATFTALAPAPLVDGAEENVVYARAMQPAPVGVRGHQAVRHRHRHRSHRHKHHRRHARPRRRSG